MSTKVQIIMLLIKNKIKHANYKRNALKCLITYYKTIHQTHISTILIIHTLKDLPYQSNKEIPNLVGNRI